MSGGLLIFFPGTLRGGCEEYALAVAREAQRRGYPTEAVFPDVRGTRTLRADFGASGIAVREWATTGDARRRAHEILAATAPVAVWLALPWIDVGTEFVIACGERALPGLCSWQLATEVVDIPPDRAAECRKSLERGMRWAAVSQHNRRHLAASYSVAEDRIDVVHDRLLAPDRFTPLAPEERQRQRAAVREELGVSASAILVLTVARICYEQKAQDLYMEAIRRIADRNVHFVWAGEGEDFHRVRADLAAAGIDDRVKILGHRDDVPALLRAADLFVLPSRSEGMPFSLQEAMACGCPTLATAVGGIPEAFRGGTDTILVPPGDAGALADAISLALAEPQRCARVAERGREAVARHGAAEMFDTSFALLQQSIADAGAYA